MKKYDFRVWMFLVVALFAVQGLSAQDESECETNTVARLVVDELAQITEDIDTFTPDRGYFFNTVPTYKYLTISISPTARQGFQRDHSEIASCPKIVAGLDKLAASLAKKLPSRLPSRSDYSVHNVAEEALMKKKINNLADHKIHYIGLKQANWLIEKNSYDIPTSRYKHGMVWVRYTPNDHPYCRAYYINVIQDYAGGGTYGASYANFVDESLVGCPTGSK